MEQVRVPIICFAKEVADFVVAFLTHECVWVEECVPGWDDGGCAGACHGGGWKVVVVGIRN